MNTAETGLLVKDMFYIVEAIKSAPEIEKALLIGSRAMGNYKPGSDVDIALLGEKVNLDVTRALHLKLNEEMPLPYFFDIIDYNHLEHQGLKDHIDKYGKVIYESKK